MDFNHQMYSWTNEGVEPSESLKTNGFQAGQKPPATVFNNFWSKVCKAITEIQNTLSGLTKSDVGLENVDNTADIDKPISTATQTALDGKLDADLTSVTEETLKTRVAKVVSAASSNGTTYTATVDGVTALYAGLEITIIPAIVSASTAPTLNINSLGAKTIKFPVGYTTTLTQSAPVSTFMTANKPLRLKYDGTYWITELQIAAASALYGTVSVSKGGTGASTLTSGAALIGNGTSAVTFRSITDNTSTTTAITANTNLITANTLRYAINRTTSVAAADTNYATYMARGTSLNSTDTAPTINGTIAWTYE